MHDACTNAINILLGSNVSVFCKWISARYCKVCECWVLHVSESWVFGSGWIADGSALKPENQFAFTCLSCTVHCDINGSLLQCLNSVSLSLYVYSSTVFMGLSHDRFTLFLFRRLSFLILLQIKKLKVLWQTAFNIFLLWDCYNVFLTLIEHWKIVCFKK